MKIASKAVQSDRQFCYKREEKAMLAKLENATW